MFYVISADSVERLREHIRQLLLMLEIRLGHECKALVHLIERFGKLGAHVLLIAGTFSAAALELIAQLTLERAHFMLKLFYLPILRGGAAELRYNNHE